MKITIALLLMFVGGLMSAQQKVILPRDESAQDPTLAIFVADLKKAIAAKDEKWIKAALDKDVMSSLGDEPGIETFLNYWTPENDSTDFWLYLKRVVDMGGCYGTR